MSSKPIPVTDISAAILGEKIYIPGGKLADGKPTDVVEVFDPRHNTWERTASLPVPISAYALATFEGKLYLFGGWDGKKFLSSVYEYDPERDLWQARTPMVSPRAFAGAAVVDSKIFVIGGYNGVKALALNDAYYPERDQDGEVPWETHAPLPQGRYAMGVTSLVDTIYVVGGNKEANGQNEEYSPQTDRWVAFENSPAKVGSGAGLAAFENKLYILGGSLSGEFVAMNQTYQAIYTVVLPFTQK
jgi:N-acetylneuraminic acid mutarotase